MTDNAMLYNNKTVENLDEFLLYCKEVEKTVRENLNNNLSGWKSTREIITGVKEETSAVSYVLKSLCNSVSKKANENPDIKKEWERDYVKVLGYHKEVKNGENHLGYFKIFDMENAMNCFKKYLSEDEINNQIKSDGAKIRKEVNENLNKSAKQKEKEAKKIRKATHDKIEENNSGKNRTKKSKYQFNAKKVDESAKNVAAKYATEDDLTYKNANDFFGEKSNFSSGFFGSLQNEIESKLSAISEREAEIKGMPDESLDKKDISKDIFLQKIILLEKVEAVHNSRWGITKFFFRGRYDRETQLIQGLKNTVLADKNCTDEIKEQINNGEFDSKKMREEFETSVHARVIGHNRRVATIENRKIELEKEAEEKEKEMQVQNKFQDKSIENQNMMLNERGSRRLQIVIPEASEDEENYIDEEDKALEENKKTVYQEIDEIDEESIDEEIIEK